MWNLGAIAEQFGQRPSAILGIQDEWAAYQLDSAVTALVGWVNGEYYKPSNRKRDGGTKGSIGNILKYADDILSGRRDPESDYDRALAFVGGLGFGI